MDLRARIERTFPDYRSGASRTMLTGLVILEPMQRIKRWSVAYHAIALRLSYIGWSQRGGCPKPDLRVTNAALFHLSYSGASQTMERARRIELRLSDRRSDAQLAGHTRRNLGGRR